MKKIIILFTLTIIFIGVCTGSQSVPTISNVDPDSGTIGTKIVITGTGFTAENNNIAFRLKPIDSDDQFKIGYITSVKSNDSKTMKFVLDDGLGACAYIPEEPIECSEILLLLQTGKTYPVSIVNKNGDSDSVNFTVIETLTWEQLLFRYLYMTDKL